MVVVSVHISTKIISVREDYTTSNIYIKLIREWLGGTNNAAILSRQSSGCESIHEFSVSKLTWSEGK